MTREEAKEIIKNMDYAYRNFRPHEYEALEMAIKALKQEPCADAISRQAAIDLADELKDDLPDDDRLSDMVMSHNEGILEYQTKLSLLPSVTPAEKVGYWIKYGVPRYGEQHYKCTSCRHYINFGQWGKLYTKEFKYCPFCGCRMVEPTGAEIK